MRLNGLARFLPAPALLQSLYESPEGLDKLTLTEASLQEFGKICSLGSS